MVHTLFIAVFRIKKLIAIPRIRFFEIIFKVKYGRVLCGTESIKYLGSKIWELIADKMKELESLWNFKRTIKLRKSTSCPCRLCEQYFYGICFL